jgi:hypothetical protein
VNGIAICGLAFSVNVSPSAHAQSDATSASVPARVQTIREQYARTNKNARRYTKKERDLSGFSTEGGSLTGYYNKNELKKIVVIYYGEAGRTIKEFYFVGGSLIFVLATELEYVAPIGGGGKDVGRIGSAEYNRFYFQKGAPIYWLGPNGNPVNLDSSTAQDKAKEIRTEAVDLLARLRRPGP